MSHTFTRAELYVLVWSEPMLAIAARLNISSVGLAKHCRKADVPVPPRGYWARIHAGYKVSRIPLPPREPGRTDKIHVGGDWRYRHYGTPLDLNAPEPPVPQFDEPIDAVRARVERRTAKVTVPVGFVSTHPDVRAYLDRDEEMRERRRKSPHATWLEPVFDAPIEQRRLRILNALFLALARQQCTASLSGEKARSISLRVGESWIYLGFEPVSRGRNSKDRKERLRLFLKRHHDDTTGTVLAEDAPGKPIERVLKRVVVDLIVEGEVRYRDSVLSSHKWRLERRAHAIAEIKRRKEEAERKKRERLVALEQARVDRLLSEAAALKRAQKIRAYVETIRHACMESETGIAPDELACWEQWALAQADRIDPVKSRAFLMKESDAEPVPQSPEGLV